MTNKQDYAPITYACNGATVDFPFSWKILEKESVVVTLIGEGLETILALGEDYNIDFDEVGGNVKTKTAYALENSIVIARKASTYQDKSFSTSGGFQASEIEKAFDNVSINLQDMDYNIENFKETFSNKINTKIEVYRDDVENQIESNKQEFLGIQSDFEDKVNTKIQQVSDAAEKINELEEAVNTAVNAANTATSKADSASAEANKATEQANLATSKANEATEIIENSLADIESKTQEEINKIKQTGFYMQNDKLYYINSNGKTKEFKAGGGLELCDIGMSLFVDETKGLRRRLNGQIVGANANTQGFIDELVKIKALAPSLFDTEENWQTTKTMSKLGQCGKFVLNYGSDGVTVTSVRLPAVVNINGLMDMAKCGLIKDESLPNITLYQTGAVGSNMGTKNGALIYTPGGVGVQGASSSYVNSNGTFDFNASRSSSTYQDNAPVQQEAIQYPYFIQIATGQETENNIKDTLELNNPFTFGMNMYFKGEMENISWLKSSGQQNTKALYPDVYNWVLTNANAGKDGFKLSTASDITDYDFEVNPTKETFKLPLKNGMEGMFASGVKGNGISLGLTDGASNAGMVNLSDAICRVNAFGSPVGYGWTGADSLKGATIGITTDSTKSGMVVDTTVPEGYNLYYFVGETVKNPNIINAGRIAEELGNKTNAEQAASTSVPDYEKAYLYQATVNTIFTAPCDGILMGCISAGRNTGNSFIDVYNPEGQIINTQPYGYSGGDVNQYAVNIKLLKNYSAKATCSPGGDIYYTTTDHTGVAGKLQFIPLKGAN